MAPGERRISRARHSQRTWSGTSPLNREDLHLRRILVTGGAGYIGRFCVEKLKAAGHLPIVLDRQGLPSTQWPQLVAVRGDIRDQDLLGRILREHRPEIVLHLAAEKSVEESVRRPGLQLINNVSGSLTLLEAMRVAGVTKIVFSSSAAVYGTPDETPVSERAALRPENPYGAGKVMVEDVLRWYQVCHGFDSISLRYFNAAGAAEDGSQGEDWTGSTNLVPRLMQAVLGLSGPLRVFGTDYPTPDGTAIRDYIHVEDLAEAHLSAIEHVMGRGGATALNLGSGRGYSVLEVIRAAEKASGQRVPYENAARRAGDPAAIWADIRAAEGALGWRPQRDLHEMVRSAWLWHSRGNKTQR